MSALLLFDIDGTLIGPCPPHGKAMLRAIEKVYDLRLSLEGIRLGGMPDQLILRTVLEQAGLTETKIDEGLEQCMQLGVAFFKKNCRADDVRLFPGIKKLLQKLKGLKLSLGLVTGNIKGIAHHKLGLCNIEEYFDCGGFGCEACERSELARRAVHRSGIEKSNSAAKVVVIGDTERDIEAGKAVGAITVSVATGRMSIEELRAHGPDYLLPELSERSFSQILRDLGLTGQ